MQKPESVREREGVREWERVRAQLQSAKLRENGRAAGACLVKFTNTKARLTAAAAVCVTGALNSASTAALQLSEQRPVKNQTERDSMLGCPEMVMRG